MLGWLCVLAIGHGKVVGYVAKESDSNPNLT